MSSVRYTPFRLNFIPEGPTPRVRVHQYDVGTMISLRGNMFYGVNANDMTEDWFLHQVDTITVAFVRGDHKKYRYEMVSRSYAESYFQFPLDAKMTAAAGPCVMSIGFDDGSDNVLWTQNFILDVEPAPVRDTDLDRNIDDPTIEDAIDDAVAELSNGLGVRIATEVNSMKSTLSNELSAEVTSKVNSMESGVSSRLSEQISDAKLEEATAAQGMIDNLAFDVDSSGYLYLSKG